MRSLLDLASIPSILPIAGHRGGASGFQFLIRPHLREIQSITPLDGTIPPCRPQTPKTSSLLLLRRQRRPSNRRPYVSWIPGSLHSHSHYVIESVSYRLHLRSPKYSPNRRLKKSVEYPTPKTISRRNQWPCMQNRAAAPPMVRISPVVLPGKRGCQRRRRGCASAWYDDDDDDGG